MDLKGALREAAYSSIEEDGIIFTTTSQWTSNDGIIFFPAATSVKELPVKTIKEMKIQLSSKDFDKYENLDKELFLLSDDFTPEEASDDDEN